jgi:hypothetical protein
MNDQKVQQALKFLSDYVQTNQDQIGSWLEGASKENFGAELILLSLEARKIMEVDTSYYHRLMPTHVLQRKKGGANPSLTI